MKSTGGRKHIRKAPKDVRSEYRFDYAKAKPNRFASRMKKDAVVVILDPDVATVFRSSDAVNSFLRSVIATMPERTHPRAKAG